MDNHSSHTSYAFLEYCLENRIVPFFLPAHTTHHLQPLDVKVFSPYQHYFTEAIDAEVLRTHGALDIGKHNFFPLLQSARKKALIGTTIKSAWKKAGLIPFNPRVIYSLLPGESTPEPQDVLQSSRLPGTPQSPRAIRRLTKKVIHQASSTPQRRNATQMSSVVDHLIVESANLRADLEHVKSGITNNRKRSRKKLVGPGVFSLEDLERMQEERAKKSLSTTTRKSKIRASKRATTEASSSKTRRVIDVEEGECIIVRPRIS